MSRERRKKRGDMYGLLLIFLTTIIVLTILIGALFYEDKIIKVDKNTFCPTEIPINKTVMLIDLSDKLNKPQIEFFLKEIQTIKRNVKKHHNFTIYLLDENLNIDKNKKFSLCNPGTQKDIENSNFYEQKTVNPKKVIKQWEELFSKKISNEIDKMIRGTRSQNTSPVLEMIQLVSIREFKNIDSKENNLIIISDMLQNTDNLSMYQSKIPTFDEFKQGDYFSKVRTNLNNNVKVMLYVLKRNGYRPMQESRKFYVFWFDFFVKGIKAYDFSIEWVDG